MHGEMSKAEPRTQTDMERITSAYGHANARIIDVTSVLRERADCLWGQEGQDATAGVKGETPAGANGHLLFLEATQRDLLSELEYQVSRFERLV